MLADCMTKRSSDPLYLMESLRSGIVQIDVDAVENLGKETKEEKAKLETMKMKVLAYRQKRLEVKSRTDKSQLKELENTGCPTRTK